MKAPNIHHIGKLLVAYLSGYMTDEGDEAFPSLAKIAGELNLSRRTVINHLTALAGDGWLVIHSRKIDDKTFTSNQYSASFPTQLPDACRTAFENIIKSGKVSAGVLAGSAPRSLPSAGDALGVVQEIHQGSAPRAPEYSLLESSLNSYSVSSSRSDPTSTVGLLRAAPKQTAPHDPPISKPKRQESQPCPVEKIVEAYHRILPMCPTVRILTDKRRAQIRQRWREDPERRSLEWWERYFGYVAKSKFLTGRADPTNGRPPFIADVEWLTTPSKMAKTIEGRYHHE